MHIRVFGDIYLNPDAVGVIKQDRRQEDGWRITVTAAIDLTGKHSMVVLETKVGAGECSDPELVNRDDFVHAEMVRAIRKRLDARTWRSLSHDEQVAFAKGDRD